MLDNPSVALSIDPLISLRKAEKSDLKFINEVQYAILMSAWGSQFNWKSWFEDVEEASSGNIHKVYLIYFKEIAVGYIWLNEELNSIWLTAIVINSKWQRKGIGTKVIHFLINEAKSENKKYIELGVQRNNLKAKEFYSKLGFNEFDYIQTANTDLLRLNLSNRVDPAYIV